MSPADDDGGREGGEGGNWREGGGLIGDQRKRKHITGKEGGRRQEEEGFNPSLAGRVVMRWGWVQHDSLSPPPPYLPVWVVPGLEPLRASAGRAPELLCRSCFGSLGSVREAEGSEE